VKPEVRESLKGYTVAAFAGATARQRSVEAERPRIIGHAGQAADNHGFFTEGNEENEGFGETLCSLCYLLLKMDQRMTQRGFDFTTEETELAETYPANPVWFFFLLGLS
jgi:hypothetical protein